jgi:hypothetical protein
MVHLPSKQRARFLTWSSCAPRLASTSHDHCGNRSLVHIVSERTGNHALRRFRCHTLPRHEQGSRPDGGIVVKREHAPGGAARGRGVHSTARLSIDVALRSTMMVCIAGERPGVRSSSSGCNRGPRAPRAADVRQRRELGVRLVRGAQQEAEEADEQQRRRIAAGGAPGRWRAAPVPVRLTVSCGWGSSSSAMVSVPLSVALTVGAYSTSMVRSPPARISGAAGVMTSKRVPVTSSAATATVPALWTVSSAAVENRPRPRRSRARCLPRRVGARRCRGLSLKRNSPTRRSSYSTGGGDPGSKVMSTSNEAPG